MDDEIRHRKEVIGLMSFGTSPWMLAEMQTCRESDFATLRLMPGGGTWLERFVTERGWNRIYHEEERDLYIYRNPAYRREDAD